MELQRPGGRTEGRHGTALNPNAASALVETKGDSGPMIDGGGRRGCTSRCCSSGRRT
uniref:Uncharacterized protein n=1 Tax=Arundo donax TaxID=35708 RepID=A0A0A9CK92_ARUDO